MPRGNVPQVELVMRSESEWLREVYDALILVFHKTKQSDLLFETGPHHPRGAISVEIGEHFEKRMRNRLSMLDRLCREMAPT